MSNVQSTSALPRTTLAEPKSVSGQHPSAARQIKEAPREFESILLGQWMQSAETTFGSVPGSDNGEQDGDDQMKSFGTQQLAKALSERGGIGIARMVSAAFSKAHDDRQTASVTTAQVVSR